MQDLRLWFANGGGKGVLRGRSREVEVSDCLENWLHHVKP